jgi:ABC-type uncharacterized transport system permease subunit
MMRVEAHRRNKVNKKFGYYIVIGLLIGAIFGMGIGAANGNPLPGIGMGALVGVFLAWFIAAATLKTG